MDNLLRKFDTLFDALREEYGVPGMAVAMVKDDQVIYARGSGVLEQSGAQAVDADTLFAIGSCTKAFTAAAVGMLAQEGKLSLDDKVTRWLPGFQLYDSIDTREITVRDLLCHRAGLPTFGGDFMGYGSHYADLEALERVRFIPPAYRLRAGYGYANLMYLAAGLVIEAASGLGWEAFIRARLLEPLGMARTLTTSRGLDAVDNVAQPHQVYAGKLESMPPLVFHNGAAAGAIVSSVNDMAKWLRCQLNGGKVGESQLIDPVVLAETRTPHALIAQSAEARALFPRRHFTTYGLGWALEDYGGRLVASHTGGVDGMLTLATFLPEEQFGLVILSNRIPHYANAVLYRTALDGVLGFDDRDWRAVFAELHRKEREQADAQRQKLADERPQGTHPSLPLEHYTGEYNNPIYGDLRVAIEGGGLVIHLGAHPGVTGPLEHWHTDTFSCRWSWSTLEESLVAFSVGFGGQVESLRLKVADFVDPLVYEFTRQAG